MKTFAFIAAFALAGCSSGPSTSSPPDASILATGGSVYNAPDDVTLDELFSDNGIVSVLWDDKQTVGLTRIGSPTPVFTTPISGGVASLTGVPLAVVVAGGTAYYVSQGALHAVSTQKGSDTVLGTPGECIPMFADPNAVFCASDGSLLSFGPEGTMEEVTDISPLSADGVYADSTTVYITAHDSSIQGTALLSAPRAGGTATMLASATPAQAGFFFIRGQDDPVNLYVGVAGGFARMPKSTHEIDDVFQNGRYHRILLRRSEHRGPVLLL